MQSPTYQIPRGDMTVRDGVYAIRALFEAGERPELTVSDPRPNAAKLAAVDVPDLQSTMSQYRLGKKECRDTSYYLPVRRARRESCSIKYSQHGDISRSATGQGSYPLSSTQDYKDSPPDHGVLYASQKP